MSGVGRVDHDGRIFEGQWKGIGLREVGNAHGLTGLRDVWCERTLTPHHRDDRLSLSKKGAAQG
ncbi:hypothetical protein GKA01_23240 [Gluconobacter kanchanaburiensis NBRC 103587]|uniref:Uncharacterized protein n=1 Tax=Gluconobacter kanchanaburiensis NBRC 103587 TaxID=1307948 RepID=A0A511BH48_9PROT|nr:hypothetical protein AA103587_1887 [Gluconobacter kanchanaburiensis NBRC 103587]GEK97127.1 hypothetical protein GKA01_23240 [Gluconobacter kanchanaburiensis NBRC 103587]